MTSAQRSAETSLRRRAPWNSRATIAPSTRAAALGGLRALEAAAGAARAEAGGEDGGALVGDEAAGLAAARPGVGRVRSPETPHGSAGIAGGALDGGNHHRSGRGRAAGLVKGPKVGGEARVVE